MMGIPHTRPNPRGFITSASFALAFLALIATVAYFYWGLGLVLDLTQWSSSLLPIGLVLVGALSVLTASWSYVSNVLNESKRLTRFAASTSLGRQLFSKSIGWEVISATYLLANLGIYWLRLPSLLLSICIWQDCVFYAFVLGQLASSFCVTFVVALVKYVT